jgi:hypothetical protein
MGGGLCVHALSVASVASVCFAGCRQAPLRVHQHGTCIAGNKEQHMGRSRGGLTSKIHAVVDGNGLPIRVGLSPGEAPQSTLSLLLTGLRPRTMLLADRGYDADWIRALANQQGAWANIPPKRNRTTRSASAPTFTVLHSGSSVTGIAACAHCE